MRWIGDSAKDETNLQKHGLDFETAALVFDDPLAVTLPDPYPYEQRCRTMGMVGSQVVIVVHTLPESTAEADEEIGRIISARKATRHERDAYEEGLL